jgi:uncharacterized protein (UPF0305 family)
VSTSIANTVTVLNRFYSIVGVDDIKSDVAYVKEREKQAQIVGPLTRSTTDRINLIRLKEFDVKFEDPNQMR